MAFKFTRDFYIPAGYELIAKEEHYGFEVYGKFGEKPCAMAFGGKRSKPDWHFSFRTEAQLQAKIESTLAGLMAREQKKKERAAERLAPHDVKVGDVFSCYWGYDQINVEFYQVVALVGEHSCKIQKIGQYREETAMDQGVCAPAKDHFIGDPQVRRINAQYGEPRVRIYDFASAVRIKPVLTLGNAPVYSSSHWTSYA